MVDVIKEYAAKIEGLLRNLDTAGFAPNFSCSELILGTGNRFLLEIQKDNAGNDAGFVDDLNKLYSFLEQELSQDIVDNLRISSWYLQIIRDKFGHAINVLCGFRPKKWEYHRGRSGRSWHCLGFAIDLSVELLTELWNVIESIFPRGEKLFYSDLRFIHFARNR